MGTIIRNNVVYGSSSSNIIELSMADYEAREAAGGIDSDVMYFIPDAEEYYNVSANTNISDFFSISKDYVTGDYCIYNNQLYEFITDKPAGSWDESKVENTTLTNIVNDLNSNTSSMQTGLSGVLVYNPETDYFGIMSGGAWKNIVYAGLWDTVKFLYNAGDTCESVTGGYTAYAYRHSTSGANAGLPSITYNDTSMKIARNDQYVGSVFTNNKIDLTGYNTLNINCKVANGGGGDATSATLCITDTLKNKYVVAKSKSITAGGSFSIDVSDLTGEYYIVLRVYCGNITVYSLDIAS